VAVQSPLSGHIVVAALQLVMSKSLMNNLTTTTTTTTTTSAITTTFGFCLTHLLLPEITPG